MRLKGVSVALRKCVKPASTKTSTARDMRAEGEKWAGVIKTAGIKAK